MAFGATDPTSFLASTSHTKRRHEESKPGSTGPDCLPPARSSRRRSRRPPPPTSPAEGTGRRQRRSAKRKSTHPVVVSGGSKRSSAERRRTLRNERMATIDYAELVLRLAELVSEVGVEKVTLDEISKLYQVRCNARVAQSCGSSHG